MQLITIFAGGDGNEACVSSTDVDKKSLETELSIAICRPTGDKWQLKTLFLSIFNPPSSIVKSVFDCHISDVVIVSVHHRTINDTPMRSGFAFWSD